jgi:hypothetical protein
MRSTRAVVRGLLDPDRRCSRWLVAGLVAGLVLAPAAAVAATLSVVHVVGSDGIAASVTRAGQLEANVVAPSAFRAFHDYDVAGSHCDVIYTAPRGYALVLQAITVDVYDETSAGPGVNVRASTNAACTMQLADVNPQSDGATSIVLNPGVVIASGRSLYAIGDNGADAELYGYGYLEPAADAPIGTGPQGNTVRAPSNPHAGRTPYRAIAATP